MRTGPLPKVLAKKHPGGFWGNEKEFYDFKNKETVWNVILAQLGADGSDERVRIAAEFLLKWAQHDSGGFGYHGSANGGMASSILHGNAWQPSVVDVALWLEG